MIDVKSLHSPAKYYWLWKAMQHINQIIDSGNENCVMEQPTFNQSFPYVLQSIDFLQHMRVSFIEPVRRKNHSHFQDILVPIGERQLVAFSDSEPSDQTITCIQLVNEKKTTP
jgi:hypothetical protein